MFEIGEFKVMYVIDAVQEGGMDVKTRKTSNKRNASPSISSMVALL